MINIKEIRQGNFECVIDLNKVYSDEELVEFNGRWKEFVASDEATASVIKRTGNKLTYPHKSWIPIKKDNRPPVLMLFGNSASHSVKEDIYFSYEGHGSEHRFWKVLRDLKIIKINKNPETIKQDFLDLNYDSPFRLGFEVLYTFPTPASGDWSGVKGVRKLFRKKVMDLMFESERQRLLSLMREFTKDGGAVIAFQKNAYEAAAQNKYTKDLAWEGKLRSRLDKSIRIFGTPPTGRMSSIKELLMNITREIKLNLCNANTDSKIARYL
jgi:hypothetical protein